MDPAPGIDDKRKILNGQGPGDKQIVLNARDRLLGRLVVPTELLIKASMAAPGSFWAMDASDVDFAMLVL